MDADPSGRVSGRGVVQSFQICCTVSCSGDFVTRSLSDPNALSLTGLYIAFKSKA